MVRGRPAAEGLLLRGPRETATRSFALRAKFARHMRSPTAPSGEAPPRQGLARGRSGGILGGHDKRASLRTLPRLPRHSGLRASGEGCETFTPRRRGLGQACAAGVRWGGQSVRRGSADRGVCVHPLGVLYVVVLDRGE